MPKKKGIGEAHPFPKGSKGGQGNLGRTEKEGGVGALKKVPGSERNREKENK